MSPLYSLGHHPRISHHHLTLLSQNNKYSGDRVIRETVTTSVFRTSRKVRETSGGVRASRVAHDSRERFALRLPHSTRLSPSENILYYRSRRVSHEIYLRKLGCHRLVVSYSNFAKLHVSVILGLSQNPVVPESMDPETSSG